MASKIFSLILPRRLSIHTLKHHFYSTICPAADFRYRDPVTHNPNSPDFESAIRFLNKKLQSDRLIAVLDCMPDPAMAAGVFRWASKQSNYRHTPEIYSRIILKLGLAGEDGEMGDFVKELVRLECPETQQALDFLIVTLSSNHRLREALLVFESTCPLNHGVSLSACNVLLAGLGAEEGNFESTLFVYKEMVKGGVLPDVETLNCVIKGLCETGRVGTALDQFRRMRNKRCAPNSRTFEMVVSALCASGRVEELVKVLDEMVELGLDPDITFYRNVIPVLCTANRYEEVSKLLRMTRERNLSPDLYLYGVLIQCLYRNRRLDKVVAIFNEIANSGLPPLKGSDGSEIEPYNAVLKGYCDIDRLTEAICLLEKMVDGGSLNTLSWNIVIRGLSDRGYVRKAFEVLGRMIVSSYMPDHTTYSSIIVGYCKLGSYDDALNRFRQACIDGMHLDSDSCSELIEGLCLVKKIQEATEVFCHAIGKGYMLHTNSLNALIQENCFEGAVEESIRIRSLAYCNGTSCVLLTYTTIMVKLLEMKRVEATLILLSQMFVEGCSLDGATYCLLICGLCSESTVREAALLFECMIHDGYVPDSETTEMLVLCMGKCSQLHKMMNVIYRLIDEEGLHSPTVCNTVVSGLLKEGHKLEAGKFLDWMLDKDWVPDAETHGLLVGSTKIGKMDTTIEEYEDLDNDKVSDILAEGLENCDGLTVQR